MSIFSWRYNYHISIITSNIIFPKNIGDPLPLSKFIKSPVTHAIALVKIKYSLKVNYIPNDQRVKGTENVFVIEKYNKGGATLFQIYQSWVEIANVISNLEGNAIANRIMNSKEMERFVSLIEIGDNEWITITRFVSRRGYNSYWPRRGTKHPKTS
jgi:hypothetical protein